MRHLHDIPREQQPWITFDDLAPNLQVGEDLMAQLRTYLAEMDRVAPRPRPQNFIVHPAALDIAGEFVRAPRMTEREAARMYRQYVTMIRDGDDRLTRAEYITRAIGG